LKSEAASQKSEREVGSIVFGQSTAHGDKKGISDADSSVI
jgi:hypothetical protein